MDFYAFNCLPRDQRAELVWKRGRFLAIRTEMNCSVVLYHMSGFFVEVWYSPEDNQSSLSTFTTMNRCFTASFLTSKSS